METWWEIVDWLHLVQKREHGYEAWSYFKGGEFIHKPSDC
jgi:hypothetical protein